MFKENQNWWTVPGQSGAELPIFIGCSKVRRRFLADRRVFCWLSFVFFVPSRQTQTKARL